MATTVATDTHMVTLIQRRMERIGMSQYELAQRLSRKLGIGQHAADSRLRRSFREGRIDFGFASTVAREIGLRIRIEER